MLSMQPRVLAANYGPDWPGIMALLAGENGYMQHASFVSKLTCRAGADGRIRTGDLILTKVTGTFGPGGGFIYINII